MAEVVWSDDALYELVQIRAYIAVFDARAADRVVANLTKSGRSLSEFPNRDRPGPFGTRELVTVAPYILQYDVTDDSVTILRVRHGRQRPLNLTA